MAEMVRTTLAFKADLYAKIKSGYRELGFTAINDLVNEAVQEYLQKRAIEEKDRLMEAAAADPKYRALLGQISDEWAEVDAEGLGPEY